MADDFGLRIGIEGERDFKKDLSDINQSFKVLGSEMALVTSQFDKNDKSVHALTSRNEVLNKEIDQQRTKIETLRQHWKTLPSRLVKTINVLKTGRFSSTKRKPSSTAWSVNLPRTRMFWTISVMVRKIVPTAWKDAVAIPLQMNYSYRHGCHKSEHSSLF